MTIPTPRTPAEAPRPDLVTRFFGGPPLSVIFRLVLLSILVGQFLGVQTKPITYEVEGATRIFKVEKIIDGAVTPVAGRNKGEPVVIRNSEYWIAPDITVARADTSRVRAFGRKTRRCRRADAAGRPRHQGHLSIQSSGQSGLLSMRLRLRRWVLERGSVVAGYIGGDRQDQTL